MFPIYVGDARDVIKRILANHCAGNVEGSALRLHIAKRKGFPIKRTKRSSGSVRVRLDIPKPRLGEDEITAYIKAGNWKYTICSSYEEAHDFQWFVVSKLQPILNVDQEIWKSENESHYQRLFESLMSSPFYSYKQLRNLSSGSGVYTLYHDEEL